MLRGVVLQIVKLTFFRNSSYFLDLRARKRAFCNTARRVAVLRGILFVTAEHDNWQQRAYDNRLCA